MCLDGCVALRLPVVGERPAGEEALAAHRSKKRPGLRCNVRGRVLGMGAAKLASGQPGSNVQLRPISAYGSRAGARPTPRTVARTMPILFAVASFFRGRWRLGI